MQLIRDILTKSVSAGMTSAGSGSPQRWWVGDSEEKMCQEESPGRQAEPVTVIVSSELMFVFSD